VQRFAEISLSLAAVALFAGQAAPPARQAIGRLMVVPPAIAVTGNPGNVGRDFVRVKAEVTARLADAARQRFPDVTVADGEADARAKGATHLLVPVITEWTEMRTDDPIGVFTLPHDRITMTLRLLQLQPPALVATATFHNQGRLSLNRGAVRLLDDRFRRLVLHLFDS
jgi:hypothetical protein